MSDLNIRGTQEEQFMAMKFAVVRHEDVLEGNGHDGLREKVSKHDVIIAGIDINLKNILRVLWGIGGLIGITLVHALLTGKVL